MTVPSVDDLRRELRDRGYLSHAIERWFAQDPWSSRAFWLELTMVAAKAALLIALFAILPLVAVMLIRNHPLSAGETLLLSLLYGLTAFVISFLLLVAIALALKLRPALAIDTPRALLAISFCCSALVTAAIAVWWYRFPAPPSTPELFLGIAAVALLFLVTTMAVSAALLSFSIYEVQRVPAIHQRPRGVPMTIAASILIALLFVPTFAQETRTAQTPLQVVTSPTARNVALIAIDGLTYEIFRSRADLARHFVSISPVSPLRGGSTTERWSSLGTGVKTSLHGVRAVEGVRLRAGRHILQSVSPADVVLLRLAEGPALAAREPLPPTIRRRDFVWEIFASRGLPSLAVNWWTSGDAQTGALHSVGQTSIFAGAPGGRLTAAANALRVDASAERRFLAAVDHDHPRFATVYLPALDILLNRLSIDPSAKLAASVRALDGIAAVADAMRARGYDVVVAGMAGDAQNGADVIAASVPLAASTTPFDVAPTLCTLMGFPPSAEMPGRSLAGSELPRIASYGPRASNSQATKLNEEYYENLKSLGYIR